MPRIKAFLCLTALLMLVGSDRALLWPKSRARALKKRTATRTEPVSTAVAPEKWALQTLSALSLREKVGQMIMVPFTGRASQTRARPWRALTRLIREDRVGGLIMYRGEPHQAARLTNKLQSLSKLPLIFASDFERGAYSQLHVGAPFTTNMAVGATGSEDYAYFQGKVTAREARALGIHWVLAPVADINNNPDNPIINVRSYGEDPALVARMVRAFVRGVQENGAIATLKHFPGHGDTSVDSHIGLAAIASDRSRLDDVELVPFKAGLEGGARSVMVAHLAVPKLTHDDGLPASLSPEIINGLLRRDLGYKGLVITDGMNMGGVTKMFKGDEAAVRAVEAGADVVLTPPDPALAIKGILRAVQSGRLTPARIDESVRRILQAKAQLGLHRNRYIKPADVDKVFGSKVYAEEAQAIADRSITLLRNEDRVVPVKASKTLRILTLIISDEGKSDPADIFQEAVAQRVPSAEIMTLNGRSGEAEIKAAMEKAGKAALILCAVYTQVRAQKGTVALPGKQADIINQLLQLNKPVLMVAFGSPYIIRQLPGIKNYLITYSLTEAAQRAAAKVIFGEIEAKGRLPISIPGLP